MANLLKQGLLLSNRSPLTQFQRFRGKINIQRPRKPHYERARVIAVTQPQYPEPPKTLTCFQPPQAKLQAKTENPYNDIIAREVLNWLQHSRTIAIFHMNPISSDDLFPIRVQLHKQNMHYKSYGMKIIEKAVRGTPFEALLPLFSANHHGIIFSTEQRVAQMLRITRRVPQMILLAGVVDHRLLSRKELVDYAQLPGLQAAQAELAQTLNLAAGNLVQHLEAHQNHLVRALDVYAKGDTSTKAEPTEPGEKA